MTIPPEPTLPSDTAETRAAGPLPPEVEAELRRRQSSAPAAPLLQPYSEPSPAPEIAPPAAKPPPPEKGESLRRFGPIGVLLATVLKYVPFLLKFGLVVLKTGGTMLLSIWVYALLFGWRFGAGFVLLIFVHELGHVFAAWCLGVPVTAPVFIPLMGALILQKRSAKSAWDEAIIGIGGPLAGTIGSLVCLWVYQKTGSKLMLGLAYLGFFNNLFNLTPLFPLDGGWITGAISPRIWLVGMVGMLAAFLTGQVQNPMILLLLFMSFPRLWRGLTTGEATQPGSVPATPTQRVQMGVAYVALAGLLFWLMGYTHRTY